MALCLSVVYAIPAASPFLFFFFNDTATTEIYTLSLHDALPIFAYWMRGSMVPLFYIWRIGNTKCGRSEEHTSELQSRPHLVCRLLLEKKTRPRCWRRNRLGASHWPWFCGDGLRLSTCLWGSLAT